ncbi:MAG: CHAT domain-containing protein [Streptosporangiaceae bacterium]
MPEADVWAEYRDRVEREHPNYARARFRREIEKLLGQLKALDDQIADLVRPLSPEEFATLSGILDLLRRQQAAAVGIGPDRDYPQWYNEFVSALGAGQIDFGGWAGAERLGSLVVISDRIIGLRQVAPQPPGPAPWPPPAAPDAGEVRDPAIVAAAEPLFDRFRAIIGRVAPGSADPGVDGELEALLSDMHALGERTRPGTPDRTDSDTRIGRVLNQLGRSAAFQGHGRMAAGWYAQAADVWRSLGDDDAVADCLQRSALAVLASDGDVDHALELILAELDRQPPGPSVFRARLLAQIASILATAGDSFNAATRVSEAAIALTALGFADPTGLSAEQSAAAWITGGRTGQRTQATLGAATTLWVSTTETRSALPPADRARSGTDASEAMLTSTLSELGALANRLGTEASAATARIDADIQALLAPLAPPAAPAPAARPAPAPGPGPVSEPPVPGPDVLAEALIQLRNRWDVTEDTPGLEAILAEAGELEQAATAARLPALAATAALLRGDTLSWLKRNDAAAEILTTACQNLEQAAGIADSERRTLLVQLLIRTAMVHAMHGDFAASSAAAEKGIAIAELDRGKASSPYLQDSYLRERRRLYDAGVFAAYKLDRRDLLLRRAELVKARGSLGWLAGPAGAPDPETPDLKAEFRALAADGDPAAEARRRILWTRLMAQQARRHGTAALAPFSLAAVQARLGPQAAVVYHHWLTRTTLLIVTIDHRDVAVDKVDLADTRDDLADMATELAALTRDVGWLDQYIPPLGGSLLPQEGAALLEGKRRLLISPQGFLHQLPFHAFDWEGEPLISRFAVSYIPNLTTLLAERAAPAPHGAVFGLAVSDFPAAGPLKLAPAELAGVTAAYDGTGTKVTTLVAGAATREHLDSLGASGQLRDFRVLHLATHGQSGSSADPYSAKLLLADGHVDGLDISQWSLGAELVVLSACQVGQRAISGRSEAPPSGDGQDEALFGDEMFGLPAAFFGAGAREVLGALWRVKDESALTMMPALHQHLAAGLPCDEALAQAVDAYRRQTPDMYKWAPLKLVSLGRPAGTTKP